MKLLRVKEGGVLRFAFEPGEANFLAGLPARVEQALEHPSDPRFFPRHTEGDSAEADLCGLLHPELKAARLERAAALRREVEHAARTRRAELELDEDAAHRWLLALNDLRLVFAGELKIDADDWPARLTSEQRAAPAVQIYLYLTGLQGALLEALQAG